MLGKRQEAEAQAAALLRASIRVLAAWHREDLTDLHRQLTELRIATGLRSMKAAAETARSWKDHKEGGRQSPKWAGTAVEDTAHVVRSIGGDTGMTAAQIAAELEIKERSAESYARAAVERGLLEEVRPGRWRG